MVKPMERELLNHIEAFIKAYALSASKFGLLALNDKNFVRDLRTGNRRVLIQTAERVQHFMADFKKQAA